MYTVQATDHVYKLPVIVKVGYGLIWVIFPVQGGIKEGDMENSCSLVVNET